MQSIPFHPLADLFPLIEGSEFDELVASVREHGLREEIVLLKEMILDGRNRYRACQVAGIEPRFKQFPADTDPYSFVIDMNIHRRHLNESQRAMIGAQIATRRAGGDHGKTDKSEMPPTLAHTAKLLNVSEDSIVYAKRVLRDGTPEEVAAVKAGKARVRTISDQIRKQVPPEERHVDRQKTNTQRAETARINGHLWGELRDAVINLTSLPKPSEVVRIARFSDKAGLLDARLFSALQYLKEFAHEWSNRNQVGRTEEPPSEDHSHTGTGD